MTKRCVVTVGGPEVVIDDIKVDSHFIPRRVRGVSSVSLLPPIGGVRTKVEGRLHR